MTATRREFLQAVATGTTALGVGWTHGTPIEAAERAALDAARKQAAGRRRRVIYNNDGDDIWAKGADTVEKFLALRHEPLLGTQVDSIFYCTTQSFNLFTHATKVAEEFRSREGTFADNNLPQFQDQQTDGLRMSCEFARQHGLESIWTLRMNDIHDAWTPQFVSQWKKDDPRRVMAAIADVSSLNDRRRLWSLVDFEHPDVEPRIVAIIEEVLRNYPVDGVDLDFLRAPFYFRSTYEGKPATDKQMGILTRLVERIRETVLAESERQGKPFLLAARVPVTKELCRYMGIDIATWLPAGLIDVLTIGGGYVVFDQPVAGLIDLGQKHSVPVYPCLSLSGLLHRPPRGNGFALPPAAWYTAAERCFDAGAAGIHCFNLFPGPYNGWKSFDGTGSADAQHDHARAILSRVGSPDTLRAADKLYAISDAGNYMPAHYWSKDAEEFSIALPVELKKNKATLLPDLVVGKHFTVPDGAKVELRIDVSGLAADLPLSVTFNSTQLGEATNVNAVAEVRRHSYAVPAAVIRPGVNRVALTVPVEGARTTGTELWVRRL